MKAFIMFTFIAFQVFGAEQTMETEQFCKLNKGISKKLINETCFVIVLCNVTKVDVTLECSKKKTFFSFAKGVILPDEEITSVSLREKSVFLTTVLAKRASVRSRVIRGIPSMSDEWQVLHDVTNGAYKYNIAGELLYTKTSDCLVNKEKNCYKNVQNKKE